MSVVQRLADLGLTIPPPPQPLGSYRAVRIANGIMFISGQVPSVAGQLRFRGRVGAELSADEGREAARVAALNVLAQIGAAPGGFEALESLLHVEGHISSAPGFIDQPAVLDGASDLFNRVLGEKSAHTRSVFGPARLPLDVSVELIVTAAVRPQGPADH